MSKILHWYKKLFTEQPPKGKTMNAAELEASLSKVITEFEMDVADPFVAAARRLVDDVRRKESIAQEVSNAKSLLESQGYVVTLAPKDAGASSAGTPAQ